MMIGLIMTLLGESLTSSDEPVFIVVNVVIVSISP